MSVSLFDGAMSQLELLPTPASSLSLSLFLSPDFIRILKAALCRSLLYIDVHTQNGNVQVRLKRGTCWNLSKHFGQNRVPKILTGKTGSHERDRLWSLP